MELFLTLDALVPLGHPYRKLDQLLPFDKLSLAYRWLYSPTGRKEKGLEFGLRALMIQFMEDLSDREMERYLQENLACKWFCDMDLGETAADHSYFGDFRERLGTERLMDIFSQVRNSLRGMGVDSGEKNRDKDCWLSAIRAPYERVFAYRNKKVRYRGLVKAQFQVGIRALAFNLKRLMILGIDRITFVSYIG